MINTWRFLARLGGGTAIFVLLSIDMPACECCPDEARPVLPSGTFAVSDPENQNWQSGQVTFDDHQVQVEYTLPDGSMWRVTWSTP